MRRSQLLRFVCLGLLVVVLLTVVGVMLSDWLGDYQLYRKEVALRIQPGEETKSSLKEFLQYRRGKKFYDVAEHLTQRKASAEDVRGLLGEPDQVIVQTAYGETSWFYSGPVFRGRRHPTVVFRFDLEEGVITSLHYLTH